MCQAPIGKVVEASGASVSVEYKGRKIKLNSRLADLKEGDYVLFSGDIAIDRIDREEAEAVLGGS